MATITALTEDFGGGAPGAAVTTGNSFIDVISGTATGQPTFSDSQPLALGWQSARVNTVAETNINQLNVSALGALWLGVYVRVGTLPGANTGILNWYNGSTKIGDIQLSADGSLRLRDNNTAVWVSSPLPAGWHRLAVRMQPGSASGHQVRVYSGAGLHGDVPSQDSGVQAATASGQALVDNIRFGCMSANTVDVQFARFRGDDAAEPSGLPVDPVPSQPTLEHLGNIFVGGTGGTSLSTWGMTLTDGAPVGATVIGLVAFGSTGADITVSSITDNRGNTWAVDLQPVRNASTIQTGIIRTRVATALQVGDTVTLTIAPAINQWCVVLSAFNGIVEASPLLATASNIANSASMSAGTTASVAAAGKVHIAAFGSALKSGVTPDAGWTALGTGASTTRQVFGQFRLNPPDGTQTAAATAVEAGVYAGVQAVYEATTSTLGPAFYYVRGGQLRAMQVRGG